MKTERHNNEEFNIKQYLKSSRIAGQTGQPLKSDSPCFLQQYTWQRSLKWWTQYLLNAKDSDLLLDRHFGSHNHIKKVVISCCIMQLEVYKIYVHLCRNKRGTFSTLIKGISFSSSVDRPSVSFRPYLKENKKKLTNDSANQFTCCWHLSNRSWLANQHAQTRHTILSTTISIQQSIIISFWRTCSHWRSQFDHTQRKRNMFQTHGRHQTSVRPMSEVEHPPSCWHVNQLPNPAGQPPVNQSIKVL